MRRDAEHQHNLKTKAERERTESPSRRAARLAKEAEEVRERDALIDDAGRVYSFAFECRDVIEGEPVLLLSLKPRPDARVTTREGDWMKRSQGRLWVTEHGHRMGQIHRLRRALNRLGHGGTHRRRQRLRIRAHQGQQRLAAGEADDDGQRQDAAVPPLRSLNRDDVHQSSALLGVERLTARLTPSH